MRSNPATELHWLATVCREIRQNSGVSQEKLARYVGVSREKIRRFENEDMRRLSDIESIVALYAMLEDPSNGDARKIYQRALERWKAAGDAGRPAPPEPEPMPPPFAGPPLPPYEGD